MKKEEQNRNNIINPFSESFLQTWKLWIDYKLEEHNFKYKGCISEQMAIKHVFDLSDGDEQKAVKIIEQSIRRTWAGFFPLKETTHGTATKTINIKQSKPTVDDITDRVSSAANDRYGNWNAAGGKSNLKAV